MKSQPQTQFDDKDELMRAKKPPVAPLKIDLASQIKTSIYGGSSQSATNIDSQFSFLDQSKLFKMKNMIDQNSLGKQKTEVDDLLAYLDKFEEEINQIGQKSQKNKKATPLIRIEQSTYDEK